MKKRGKKVVKNKQGNSIIKEIWIRRILWIVVLALCVPFVHAAGYALFRADDFVNYATAVQGPGNSYFVQAINETIRLWRGWQGTHVSCFFLQILNPLQFYSYGLLRIILGSMILCAFCGVFMLSAALLDYCNIDRKKMIYLVALFLIPLLSYREYQEIYLWYTGAMVYLLPVVFFLFGMSCLLWGKLKKKKSLSILAGILMVLMTGGVLEVVGMSAFLLLLLLVVDYLREHKFNLPFIVVFAVTLLGALTNALAPGNFARHKVFDESRISLLRTVRVSMESVVDTTKWMYEDTTIAIFIILAFLFGYWINRKIKPIFTIGIISGLILLPVVTVFPVIMGYSSQGVENFPNRCLFALDASIIAGSIGIAIMIGNELRTHNKLLSARILGAISSVVIIAVIITNGQPLNEYIPVAIAGNFREEKIQSYANDWITIFEEIQSSGEENVVVSGQIPEYVNGCSYTFVAEDSTHWANVGIAEYFDKKSVCMVPEPDGLEE